MKIGCVSLILLLAVVLPAWADGVPNSINYQGVLLDGTGGVLPAGTKTVRFQLYGSAASTDTNALWSRTTTVLLDSNGLFNVTLSDDLGGGDSNKLAEVIASNSTLLLGLKVESNNEIVPRQQLLAVPFALKAGDVSKASDDFEVGNTLTVGQGAQVSGQLEANDGLKIGANKLTTNSTGTLAIDGNVEVTEELQVDQNLTVDGTTTLQGLTTVSNLTVNGTLVAEKGVHIGGTSDYAASGEENLRIVRGSVFVTNSNPQMTSSYGSGWSAGNPVTGEFIITFTTPFSDVPTVTANVWSDKGYIAVIKDISASNCTIYLYNFDTQLKELPFTFIAVGPR